MVTVKSRICLECVPSFKARKEACPIPDRPSLSQRKRAGASPNKAKNRDKSTSHQTAQREPAPGRCPKAFQCSENKEAYTNIRFHSFACSEG